MRDILEQDESPKKINFVVGECDGEDLDESEANHLNKLFNESLKQSFIFLIVQPIKNLSDCAANRKRENYIQYSPKQKQV